MSALKTVWRIWKATAFRIGLIQSRILLTVLYWLVVAPFALAVRLFSDPLQIRAPGSTTYYRSSGAHARGLDEARRQY
jgi:hypothetical protein